MTKTINQKNLKQRLLSGSSMAAVLAIGVVVGLSGHAHATDVAAGTAGAATPLPAGTITTTQDDAFGFIDANGTVAITGLTIDHNTTIYVSDSSTGGEAVTFGTAAPTIASGKSLTFILGAGVNGSGLAVAAGVGHADLTFSQDVTATGATISIVGVAAEDAGDGSAVDFAAALNAGTLNVTGGAGGAAIGSAVTLTDVTNASAITTVNLKAGAGANGLGNFAGGGLTITDFGTAGAWTGTTMTIAGGAGGSAVASSATDSGDGGAVATGSKTTGALNGNVVIAGGNAGTAGAAIVGTAGGNAGDGGAVVSHSINGAITGSLTVTGGAGSSAGGSSSNAVGGTGGVGGQVTLATVHSATANVTATAGSGGDGADGIAASGSLGGNGGAITLTDAAATAVIGGNFAVTSGSGGKAGDGVAAAVGGVGGVGGAIIVTDVTQNITGNATVIAGNGGIGGSTAGTATGAVGGVGGLVTVTEISSITGNYSVTSGTGATGGAVTLSAQVAGAGGAGGAVILAATATGVTGNVTLVGGAGGAGGAATGGTGTGGKGGAGGTLTGGIHTGNITGNISMTAGDGGNGADATTGATGGAGGTGSTVTFAVTGNVGGTITLNDGEAGTAGGGVGTGGALGAAGTADLTLANSTVTGDVSAAANSEGSITTGTGAVVFSGNVGTSTNSLRLVAAGVSTTFTKNLYSTSTTATDGTAIIFAGTTEQIVGGAMTGDADVTINAGSTANFKTASTIDTLTLTSTSTLKLDDSLTLDTITLVAGNILTLTENIIAGETAITSGAASTFDVGLTVNMPETFTSGTITLISDAESGAGTAAAAAAAMTMNSSVLATYTAAANGNLVDVTATKKSTASIASAIGVSTETAASLDSANTSVATGDATAKAALNTALAAGGATAKQAAEEIAVQADTLGAGASVALGTGAQVVGVAQSRLASVRTGGQYASAAGVGFNTGDEALTNAAWIKPFGNVSNQDDAGGVSGYGSDTLGVAVGVDTLVDEDYRVGASFAYSGTDVDGDGAGNSQLDIKSYQVTLYGDYTAKDYYVEGMAGYAMNKTDTTRTVAFGGLNRTAAGEYDSNQYMVSVGGGMPMNIGNGTFFTPTAGLAYTHVSSDSYTETGAGNLNLTVNPDDVDALLLSIGGKLATTIKSGTNVFIPEFRAGISYDLAGDEATATGTYTGGGAAFTTTGTENEELAGNLGLGVTADAGQGVTVAVNYDADIKDGFLGHSASLEARFKF